MPGRTTAFSRVCRQPAHSMRRERGASSSGGSPAWRFAVVASPLGRGLRSVGGAWPRVAVVAPQPVAVRLASAFMNNRPTERPRLFVDPGPNEALRSTEHHNTSQRGGVCSFLAAAAARSRLLIAMSVCGTVPVAESPRARTSTSRQPTAVSRCKNNPTPAVLLSSPTQSARVTRRADQTFAGRRG